MEGAEKESTVSNQEAAPEAEVEEDPERSAEEDLWSTWSRLVRNWDESSKKNGKLIKQLIRKGIPNPMRGMVWQLLVGPVDDDLKAQYPALITEISPFEKQIQRDLARTYPEHSFFKEKDGLGQESLLNVLKAYSIHDKEVGYCQGSPFIVGMLLMQMPEEDAFCVFTRLMKHHRLRDLFKPSMADLELCFFQLEKLVAESLPKLQLHFQAVGFMTSMYASPWFLTLFSSVLSLSVAFRVMDIFLQEGREIVFKVGLALLEHSQPVLLHSDMEDMLKHFQKEMKIIHDRDPENLFQMAFNNKCSHKKMKRLEKEHQQIREKKASESLELIRFQSENWDLVQRIKVLEKECESLANRLIEGQVSRAQEAEEMFIVKRELAKAKKRIVLLEEEKASGTSVSNGCTEPSPESRSSTSETPDNKKKKKMKKKNAERPSTATTPVVGNRSEKQAVMVVGERDGGGGGGGGGGNGPGVAEDPDGSLSELLPHSVTILTTPPSHVCKEEAEQVLRVLGVNSPGTSPRVSMTECYPRPKLTSTATQTDLDHSLVGISILEEFATAKTMCADVSLELEQKRMELRKALHREAVLTTELVAVKQHTTELEEKLLEARGKIVTECRKCRGHIKGSRRRASSSTTQAAATPDRNSASHLLSNLRASWRPQASSSPSSPPSSPGPSLSRSPASSSSSSSTTTITAGVTTNRKHSPSKGGNYDHDILTEKDIIDRNWI